MSKSSRNPLSLLAVAAVLLAALPGQTAGAAPIFPDPTYPVGPNPGPSVAADFNGDGTLDVAVANLDTRDVSCLLGGGNGTFAPERRSAFGSLPSGLAAGQFDGDGRMDLVIVSGSSSPAAVLAGLGDGTFTPPSPIGAEGDSVAVADFNDDGKADLAFTSSLRTIVVLGAGDGSFGPPRDLGLIGSRLAAADLNGDAHQDLIVTGNPGTDVAALLGNGDGTFGPPIRSGPPVEGPFAIGDFNLDDHPDLALGDFNSRGLVVLLGASDGSFTALAPFSPGDLPAAIEVGDFDRDGLPDLIVGTFDRGETLAFLGTGEGLFSPRRLVAAAGYPSSLVARDFDADGVLDLVAVSRYLDDVCFLAGRGDGSFGRALSVPVPGNPLTVALGDFNNDGTVDLATSSGAVLLGLGGGRFADPVDTGARGIVAAGDLNADGRQDLALARFGLGRSDPGDVAVVLGRGDGTFAAPVRYPAGTHPTAVALADFNGDGSLDVAVANLDSMNVSVLPGRGDGTLSPAVSTTTGPRPTLLAIADFNADGRPDLAVPYEGFPDFEPTGGLSILIGRGDGTFSLSGADAGPAPSGAATGDFDGDGHQDVAVGDALNESALVLLGMGDGTFAAPRRFHAGHGPIFVVAADVDADGFLDLITIDALNEAILLIGAGDGSFGPEIHLLAGVAPFMAAAGDVDGDGFVDLVVPHVAVHDVWLVLNQTADRDHDGVPDESDNCPTVFNPDQDPQACEQSIVDIFIEFGKEIGGRSGLVTWRTTHEVNLSGFNIVAIDKLGRRTRMTGAPVACDECATGRGTTYAFVVPKFKGGKDVFIEPVCTGPCSTGPFGPAMRR